MADGVPGLRVWAANEAPVDREGAFVLYWMTAFRRPHWNFALERAVEIAVELDRPLVVLEALRCDYPWASTRLHSFVLDGMRANATHFEDTPALYHPYVEPEVGAGKGLLAALGERACAIVADDYPAFFLPAMLEAAAERLDVKMEAVDSNGLMPLQAANETFATAYLFRRFLQKALPQHLADRPRSDPLAEVELPSLDSLPDDVLERWPAAPEASGGRTDLDALPVDAEPGETELEGGFEAGEAILAEFLEEKLERYADERNQPEADVGSGLSPYLHFGHLSAHQVFHDLATVEAWSTDDLADWSKGKRSGWWGMSESAESFLDELVTWRELGYNRCAIEEDYESYDSLPEWARETLAEHADDEREHLYDLEEFEAAATHDPLWNAAQNQLVREGRIHNYLRMLWGKKILEWTESPRRALEVMVELNNKYALDGRDPNSYTGILWVLGLHDRAWGPERPIFGKIRYMTSDSTARKYRVGGYVDRYDGERSMAGSGGP